MTEPNVIAYHIKDAVRASGSTRTKIYQAIAKGELKARKNGRRTIILADDLAAWVRSLPLATPRGPAKSLTSRVRKPNDDEFASIQDRARRLGIV